ncbi:MAG: phosphotransferase [Thiotrichaceae bacterium]|nr:phosphotransferase [Thiotrichaceae bacterium]
MKKDENLQTAYNALRHWKLGIGNVQFISLCENITYRVESTKGEAFVLRLHRPGYHNLQRLKSELCWADALCTVGINAPIAIPTREGNLHALINSEEEHYASLLKWVEGPTLGHTMEERNDAQYSKESYEQLGEIMASLHLHASSWRIPGGFDRHAFDSEGFAGSSPVWGRFWEYHYLTNEEEKIFSSIRDQIRLILNNIPKRPDNYSLIHSDIHPYNVIVSGSKLHLIDFDDSGFGWHQYDFAFTSRGGKPALLEPLLRGYRRIRDLSDDQMEYIPFLVFVRELAELGWVSDRPEHDDDVRPEKQIAQIIESSEEILNTYTSKIDEEVSFYNP